MTGRTKAMRMVVALACAAVLSACVAQYRNHGYLPSDSELSDVIVGVDTRDTVAETIGVPGTSGVLDQGNYYYVGSRVRHYGAFPPEIVEREIVAVEFDADGVVRNITRYGLEDGRVVALTRRVTVTGDGDIGFIRQLFGNIGGINLGGIGDGG
ncbi:MAG: outer membrane protein assembly factor BamE [Marinovum algicola]|uniref:Beta-barrel assembly machine subunit BamE n=1 Tax=Marinovum algicola TaxID=42444 RepID=A0A975ZMM5_9RHOB|nr:MULTISPECIES: outer membrane protein assembly factor BamE [Marinovum]MDD9738476.1 outer membrane protein assembly factor BamE [Marinovum sp. SP66]MDD9742583.1 outer membrane protein assembly factor BamE [Marinovum sp. PR37]SEJ11481.1 Beta-barrel assembly machine subunit BamE [Marinovum algicola]SLN21161.1 SmpA / OmlA family protein [Marinovum algicola]